MRVHDDVAHARVFGQRHSDRWPLSLGVASLLQELTDGSEVRRLGLESAAEGVIERACAVEIEQFDQARGGGTEIAVALGQG
jgi:hypothetical protein